MSHIYIKSPLNYIGGKYKMLPQLTKWFPKKINTMVDLFAGGGDVFANISANRIIANDINYHIIDIFEAFQSRSIEELISDIETRIINWNLSPTNQEGYINFRSYYNSTELRDPIDLYVLVCYSFNYQIRFNNRHQFNNPFGKERSWFNPKMKENLISFHKSLNQIEFMSMNYRELDLGFLKSGDFLYADPPYLITTGSYNDGRRGFEGWHAEDDILLYQLLDNLNGQGVKFALSNVIEHKGRVNNMLNEWRTKYHTHTIEYNYVNSNYHAKNTDKKTKEVLITNY